MKALELHEEEVKNKAINVEISDIDMPFWSIMGFMIKFMLASIPAIVIAIGIMISIPGLFMYIVSKLVSYLI